MKKVIYYFLFCLIVNQEAWGQTTYIPTVIAPSPNAAALMKFTDIPVSTYTGTANVTIPIYTINAKGLSIPISLDYHTGGIKLKEEASNVGLGWALSVGGMISRTINGQDDFGPGGYFLNTQLPQPTGDIVNASSGGAFIDMYCNYNASFSSGNYDYTAAFTNITAPQSPVDLEPDVYSYNFLGHSGKFIITKNQNVIIQKQENINISFSFSNNSSTNYIGSFIITDEVGNKFLFNDIEFTNSLINNHVTASSWQISKIITNQNDTISYTYYIDGTSTIPATDIHQTYIVNCTQSTVPFSQINDAGNSYANDLIKTIIFSEGQLQFNYVEGRQDLQNGEMLQNIQLFEKSNTGLNYIREHDFFYSYFNQALNYGTASGSNYEFLRLKLDSVKEISTTAGITLPPYVPIYFSTNGLINTGKHSYSIDHWGFYNGVNNNVLIPSQNIIYQATSGGANNPGLFNYSGANREASSSSTLFALQQMRYPTGGKTVFELENNDYDYAASAKSAQVSFPQQQIVTSTITLHLPNRGITTGAFNFSSIYPVIPLGYSGTNATMIISFRSSNNDCNENYINTLGKIYFSFNGVNYTSFTEDISNSNVTCFGNSPVNTITLPLAIPYQSSTGFTWTSYIDPSVGSNFQEIDVTINFQSTQSIYNQATIVNGIYDYTLPAGGLRVKTITNYTNDSTPVSRKIYSYDYFITDSSGFQEKHSYGKLMSFPSYATQQYVDDGSGSNIRCMQLSLFGSSQTSLTSVIQNNITGYSQVTEQSIDSVSNIPIGQTIYNYFNSSDTSLPYAGRNLPGMSNIGNSLNGLLIDKIEYQSNSGSYIKISDQKSFYSTHNRQIYYSPKYRRGLILIAKIATATGYQLQQELSYDSDGFLPICPNNAPLSSPAVALFYPTLKSERVIMDSSITIIYDQNNPYQFIQTKKCFFYDNPNYYQLTRTISTDSKGNSILQQNKYPINFSSLTVGGSPNVYDTMISRNILDKIIETDKYKNGGFLQSLHTNYKSWGSSIIAPSSIYTTELNNAPDTRATFNRYDWMGNISEMQKSNDLKLSYIWGYNYAYPIAEVKNADSLNIAYTSFETATQGNWNYSGTPSIDAAITGNYDYNLTSGSITSGNLNTALSFIVSYWSKSGAASINGTTAIQGFTKNGWTYYEHKIPVGTSLITVTGAVTIDELRLFPSTAQMTTYTYDPILGMTSQCSVNNLITYYQYDAFGRLKVIKDGDNNIIKTFDYNYQH